jgi:hypothetical protein
MTAAAGFAWTAQVGIYQVLASGLLEVTDPSNGHIGTSFVISVDLSGICDLIGESK